MAIDIGLVEWVQEAMAPVGDFTMRKMMVGATLYCDGTIFAIAHEGELWFKADAETNAAWDAVGAAKFTVTFKDGTVDMMNYRRVPEAVYDDPEVLREWAALALEAGARRVVKKSKKK